MKNQNEDVKKELILQKENGTWKFLAGTNTGERNIHPMGSIGKTLRIIGKKEWRIIFRYW